MMKYVKHGLLAGVLAVAAAGQLAHAQSDTITIKRATELREAPGDTARSLAPLPVQSQVTRLGARQGPWIEVRNAQGAKGWIHMFDAGTALPAQGGNAATGALRGLTSFFGKGTAQPPASGTSTIGIRGLGAEDIANAQPNLGAVAQVEGMRINVAQARQFGSGASLTPQTVAELPAPAPPNQANAGPSGTGGAAGGGAIRTPSGGER